MAEGVLIVEDDPEIRRILQLVLQGGGHQVAVACDGLAALQHLERHRPALMLLDLVMPRMDGPALLEALRRRDLRPHMPILILSAADRGDEVATRLGVEGYVAKPFDVEALLAEVGRIMNRSAHDRAGRRPGPRALGAAGAVQTTDEAAEDSPPGALILVCEDDPMVAAFFLDALAAFGHRAVGAPDGESALRMAAELRPAAIVLDLALPGLDGGATLARLKGNPRTEAIPVVIVSAHPGRLTFLDRRQVVAVLEKPCLPAELHAAVQQALAAGSAT